MRNRWVRRVFLGLVLVFPLLISGVSARSLSRLARELRATSPIVAVETIMVGGLVFAGWERRRLLVDREEARSHARWMPARPSPALTGPRVAVKNAEFRSSVRH